MSEYVFGDRDIFGEDDLANVKKVLDSQRLWRGDDEDTFVAQFEDDFGKWLGRKYVLALSAGTAGNEAALAGLGIGPGDEVICPPCSFIASSMSIVALGAVPVFADVDPRNLIITAEAIEQAITPNAKAVVVVHLAGQPADMDPILEVAKAHNLAVMEDCAQAYGPTYKGRKVGTLGDCASYSLQQGKHITTGEGGAIATDDPEVYKRAMLYANCGMPWYRYGVQRPAPEPVGGVRNRGHFAFGHNYRMTDLQGAVAVVQLSKIEQFNTWRRELVAIIHEVLDDVPGLQLQYVYPETDPIYWNFHIMVESMTVQELSQRLRDEHEANIGPYSEVNYLEAVFQEMNEQRRTSLGCPMPDYVRYDPGTCPQAEEASKRTFSLWTHHAVDPDNLRSQVQAIRQVMTS